MTDHQPPPPDHPVDYEPPTDHPTHAGRARLEVVHDWDERTPPHNIDAERALLGSILLSPRVFHDVTATIEPSDFYRPEHETIYDAACHLYATGQPTDVVSVAEHLLSTGDLARVGGAPYLHQLIATVPVAENGPHYARIVADHAFRRRLTTAAAKIDRVGRALTAADPADLAHQAAQALAEATGTTLNNHPVRAANIDEFLETADDDTPDWVIPDVAERGDRIILTAGEGVGKSTLLRQIAVQAAAGVHPFTHHQIPPVRVLIVDLENSDRQSRRKIRPLRTIVRGALDNPDRLHIICKIDGLDLTQPTDELWLDNLVTAHRPDLLITGPIYKLASGNPNDEKDAKPAAMALDRIRAKHDCALILEAHSRKAENGDPKKRPKEPFGWSGWMRWPEMGLHLADDGTLTHWRGMRDERVIPHALNRGGHWPWTPTEALSAGENEGRYAAIRRVTWQAGKKLSEREIAQATGMSRTTVQRVLNQYAVQYSAFLGQLDTDREEAQ